MKNQKQTTTSQGKKLPEQIFICEYIFPAVSKNKKWCDVNENFVKKQSDIHSIWQKFIAQENIKSGSIAIS